jgi:beta-glucosidase
MEGEQHDRDTIALPPAQQQLFDAIYAVRQDVVVVLVHGGALAISEIKSKAAAILDVHYPGPFGGQATAEMLFGTVNPSGHLPYTAYPISYQNASNFTIMSMTDAPGRTYRYYTGTPLWRFGYGLSYTTFNMSSLSVSGSCSVEADEVGVSVTVTNTGGVAGTELVQLYLVPKSLSTQPPHVPMKQLMGFERVAVAAGGSKTVLVAVQCSRAMLTSDAGGSMARGLIKGDYAIEAVGGTDEPGLSVSWTI